MSQSFFVFVSEHFCHTSTSIKHATIKKKNEAERDALIIMSEGFQQNFKTKLFKESSSFCIESLLAKKNDENDRKPAVVEKSSPINGIQIKQGQKVL